MLYVGLDAGDVNIAGHANDGLHGELGDLGTVWGPMSCDNHWNDIIWRLTDLCV